MKYRLFTAICALTFLGAEVFSQSRQSSGALIKGAQQSEKKPGAAGYEAAENDPLNARIYTLKNGLRVYLSVYRNAPRIQTYIAVKAGSKNDPSYATGLAHYLEHMVFKGTDRFGTKDFEKESVEINKIEALYEKYRVTTDEAARKALYRQIDSISGVAAGYAIANEYDKMLAGIGAAVGLALISVVASQVDTILVQSGGSVIPFWLKAGVSPATIERISKDAGVSIGGEHRAYPLRIMNAHEIANDTLGGEPVLGLDLEFFQSAVDGGGPRATETTPGAG